MSDHLTRCPKADCDGLLNSSGVEIHRYICQKCGQHYYGVLKFIPVEDATNRNEILLEANAHSTSSRGRKSS